jgi:ATP-dependent helicase/nuclease subunit B
MRHFLLTHDATSARRVRRVLAEKSATTNVIVGEWLTLIEQARAAYLIPPLSDDGWTVSLADAMASIRNAFWSESFKLAPQDVVPEVARALRDLLIAAGPHGLLSPTSDKLLPERTRRNVNDLVHLWEAAGHLLPVDLQLASQVLHADASDAFQELSIAHDPGMPALDPWRRAVIEKLNRDNGPPPADLVETLCKTLAVPPHAPETTSHGSLARALFHVGAMRRSKDDTVQIIGVRDHLEEIEVAAGMVQKLASAGTPHADIGFLIPADADYVTAMHRVFAISGISAAGLPNISTACDPGREAAYYFLMAHAGPMPSMALAALVTNPLMPWPAEVGQTLASKIMRNVFSLQLFDDAPREQIKMRDLIKGARDGRAKLDDQLNQFAALLVSDTDRPDAYPRAMDAIEDVLKRLEDVPGLTAEMLFSDVAPEAIRCEDDVVWPKDGVAVFLEHNEPWREVRHLFVLGFRSGHYPATHGTSSVFNARDLSEIKSRLGLPVETPAEALTEARALFRRQLATASDTVRFFVPRLDAMGKSLSPSESLTFVAQTVTDVEDAEDLIIDIDDTDRRSQISDLALAREKAPEPPRNMPVHDLSLGIDLLTIGAKEEDAFKRQSPSSLEKMIVSPMAWLLSTLNTEPAPWQPDVLNPAVQGSIAHDVFEHLFEKTKPIPDEKTISEQMPTLMDNAITRLFPVLRTGMWRVEYRNLLRQVREAALRWHDVLSDANGEVIANEVWLHGHMNALPIHGGADSIISLPGNRVMIVDFKKSSSGGRRRRMELAYDSQATLYRMMIETGGAKDDKDALLVETLRDAREIGVLYYMMNDRISLTDQAAWFNSTAPGVAGVGPDVASNALREVERRLSSLGLGKIALNRAGDEKRMEKEMGLTAKYALETSPLVRMFMIDDSGDNA